MIRRQCSLLTQCVAHCQIVLVRFAESEDPLMEGHLLLEQYQAQYVAALRCYPMPLPNAPPIAFVVFAMALCFNWSTQCHGELFNLYFCHDSLFMSLES